MDPHDPALACLTDPQRAAWRHVQETIRDRREAAQRRLTGILRVAGCSQIEFDTAIESMRRHARVIVHFHPDRIGMNSVTVAEALLVEGEYRSQFETGLSAGGLTAFPGGARDAWERALFGGAYHSPDSTPADRPKYGALELVRYPDGPWPRFGSCYFVLRPEVARRTSFTFSGSEQPDACERLGTLDAMECVLAPLLAEIASGEGARVPWPPFVAPTLGLMHVTVPGLLERLSRELPRQRPDPWSGVAGRVLDTGIEAQVHGSIMMGRDVERLVVDPAFMGTSTGDRLEALCRTHAIALEWHVGFRLEARDVPAEFRGPAIPALARRIAGDGTVDAAAIGAAQASLRVRPDDWSDYGSHAEVLQHLKQLWHTLVHYGAPARS
jgi:hypothetical protein